MPGRIGIDPNKQYTDIGSEIRSQFKKKGKRSDLRYSNSKGLYVANGFFDVTPERAIRHENAHKETRKKMIAAGREVKDRLREAINCEFPMIRLNNQSLGDYALEEEQKSKLDIWARRERERIEWQLREVAVDLRRVEFPYNMSGYEKIMFIRGNLTAAEKEDLLKGTLDEEQRQTLTSAINEYDMELIDDRTLYGLWAAAQLLSDADKRNMVRDRFTIWKVRDSFPDDAVARARHAERHNIVEDNRLLRQAIAEELKGNPRYAPRAAAAAESIVSNLQTSSTVLSPSNLMRAAGLLKSLGCGSAGVDKLADLIAVKRVLRGTVPYAHKLNESIRKSLRGAEFQGRRNRISDTIVQSAAALREAAACIKTARLSNEDERKRVAEQLMDSAIALAKTGNQLFKGAKSGSSARRVAEKIAEQARIANELAAALRDISSRGDSPSLKKVVLTEVSHSSEATFLSSNKRIQTKRLFMEAIARDLKSASDSRNDGVIGLDAGVKDGLRDAKAAAANIVSQFQSERSLLTLKNIVSVSNLLDSLGFSHAHVDKLAQYADLENKMSAAVPQLRNLNQKVRQEIKSMGGDPLFRFRLMHSRNSDLSAKCNRVLDEANIFLKSGRLDDVEERTRLYNALKENFAEGFSLLAEIENETRNNGVAAPYRQAYQAIKAHMAAVCDLAQALYPSNQPRDVHREMNQFPPRDMRNPRNLKRVDAMILEDRVKTPDILFRSEPARWRADEMLAEPLHIYNQLLARVITAFRVSKDLRSHMNFEGMRALIARALILNDRVINIFNAVNKLRDTGRRGQYDKETPVLKDQRACLQALQVEAIRATNAPLQMEMQPIREEEGPDAEPAWDDSAKPPLMNEKARYVGGWREVDAGNETGVYSSYSDVSDVAIGKPETALDDGGQSSDVDVKTGRLE